MGAEWDEYHLKSKLEESRTLYYLLKMHVTNLERENQALKEQIQNLAIENSNMMDKQNSKKSKKWIYYHDHKHEIKKHLEKDNEKVTWSMVKKESDSRYLQENSLIKDK